MRNRKKKKKRKKKQKKKKMRKKKKRRRMWGITQNLLTVYKSFLVLQNQGCHSMKIM